METKVLSMGWNRPRFLPKKKNKVENRVNQGGDGVCPGITEPGKKGTWLTVGVKLILGVGLVSNLCMGVLLYTSWQATREVGEKTNQLLDLNSGLNSELRARISTLLDKYLRIPDLLAPDPAALILKQVRQGFTVDQEERVEGRSAYGAFFKRNQRRDLSNGEFVVQSGDGAIVISKGIFDAQGRFTDVVNRIHLASSDPKEDMSTIQDMIRREKSGANTARALEQKVAQLSAMLADEGLAAEKDRIKILYHLDQIKAEEESLADLRISRQKTMLVIAGGTMILNLLVLYAMTFLSVERPLRRLTRSIERINSGEMTRIPYQVRRDRIGTLAGALILFQGALQNLRAAEQQTHEEQSLIQGLILRMTDLIEDLRIKSQSTKDASFNLNGLAKDTSDQSDTAFTAIAGAEDNADGIAISAGSLQGAVRDIHDQVEKQNELIVDIHTATHDAMGNIQELNQASVEIGEIVKLVKNIAGQTRLLALNARIEASRAGAAGKGFAVVANEVRTLSNQTEAASLDVETKILAIQTACQKISNSTQGVGTVVQTLSKTATHISDSVRNQHGLSDRIAENSTAISRNIQDLFKRVSRVKEAAMETRKLSEHVRDHSSDMDVALDSLLADTRAKLGRIGKNTNLTFC